MIGVALRHRDFRRLWLAQVVSQLGDWLNRVAVVALLSDVAGPGAALGLGLSYALELAVRMGPTTFLSSFAGPLADRVSRKAVMLVTDALRAALVLCLLLVDGPEDLPLLYALIAAQMGTSIFFDAARQATLPNTVPTEELHDAIALASVTWSVMLSIGAVLGGLLVVPLGVDGVFLVDAATYGVSALFILGMRVPPTPAQDEAFRWRDALVLADMRRALRHARERRIAVGLFTKAFWGPAGALLVLLSVSAATRFGERDGAGDPTAVGTSIGVLLSARGLGTAIGPILARRLFGREREGSLRTIPAGFALAVAGYACFPLAPGLWTAALAVAVAHVGGGAIWVASTSFWQHSVDDRFRGRSHALDFLGMTLSFSTFGLVGGALYDATGSIDASVWAACGLVALAGGAWTVLAAPLRRRVEAADAAPPTNGV